MSVRSSCKGMCRDHWNLGSWKRGHYTLPIRIYIKLMCKRMHARPSITGGMWLERHKATGCALLPPLKKKRWQRLQPCASCSPASSYVIVTTHDTCKQQQQHHLLVKQKSLRPILHMRRSISFSPNSWLSHRCWTGTRNGTKHPPGITAVLWVGYSKPSKCPVFIYMRPWFLGTFYKVK
jgi:hypothetical protein